MKPPEILSMIEEAAGTRMYETKKQGAIKTLEKKQLKVDEITRILDEDISPRLNQLRDEKEKYQEWSNNNHELEKLERLSIAFEFKDAESKVVNSEKNQNELRQAIASNAVEQQNLQEEVDEIATEINQIEKKKEEEEGGIFKDLKKSEQEVSKELVKYNTNYQNMLKSLEKENENLVGFKQQITQIHDQIHEKEREQKTMEKKLLEKEYQIQQYQGETDLLQTKFQNACAGVTDENDPSMKSLPEQIGLWETKLRESQSKLQQETLKINHTKQKYSKLQEQVEIEQQSNEKEIKKMNKLKSEIKEYQDELVRLNYEEHKEKELRRNQSLLQSEFQSIQDQMENLTAQLETRLNFEFRDPVSGFDRSRVKGVVAKLIHLKVKDHATALEIAAGGKLYQVVVDNDQTGKLLLGKNVLKKRVTILPLNKINNRTIEPQKLSYAKQMAQSRGGFAELALELIGYDEEVTRAMQFVFGSAIICSSSAIAEAIAFDSKTRCRTITLEGDTYDPNGTVSGGSRNQIGSLLTKMAELSDMKERHDQCFHRLSSIEKELHEIELIGQRDQNIREKVEMKSHELKLFEDRLSGSSYSQLCNEMQTLETEIQQFDVNISQPILRVEHQARDELKRLQDSSGIQSQRSNAMKQMENSLKSSQKQLSKLKNEANQLKSNCDRIEAELDSLRNELNSVQEQLVGLETSLNKSTLETKKCEKQVQEKRALYEEIKSEMAELHQTLQQSSQEIKKLQKEKSAKLESIQTLSLESRKMAHKLDLSKKEVQVAQRRVHELEKEYPWIEQEKVYFGLERSDYDFKGMNLEDCLDKLNQLKGTQEKLAKKINKKVMGMIDKAELESTELSSKKQVILNDKEKIEAVINELDVKKVQAVQTTWVRVNKDFGSIFSTLLPGTLAKLDILEGCTVMDGLEVKVAFNGVWKESLTELSGGQRSLLALSLILALLLFKPAPMYILDEVDAALDLSHTQNIGLMLRTHFSASQFIVVSLKEGMFNNANVIFRTRFIDGISTVIRTVAGGKSHHNNQRVLSENAGNHQDEEESDSPIKKKGKSNRSTKRIGGGIENI